MTNQANVSKFNQKRATSAKQVAEVLNNCKMLIDLHLEERPNEIVLIAQTDSASIEYTEKKVRRMDAFLDRLMEYVNNKEGIEELKEELMDLVI
ncbi:hypothetical protein [Priestia flexa]|uniref:hypothetical protein n=1 Tax=Priestia flexa TaxID=86664 RepID=UPI000473CA7D|nr:hypothetical protein [Priestia flexa]